MNVDGYLANTLKTPGSYETNSMTFHFRENEKQGEQFKRRSIPWMMTNNFYYKEKLQKHIWSPKDHSNEHTNKYPTINLLTIIRS